MKILITGGSGLLGNALRRTVPEGVNASWTSRQSSSPDCFPANLNDPPKWERLFNDLQPDVLMHLAAEGSVDEAEKNPESVRKTNVEATGLLCGLCRERGTRMLFISSNAVYEGDRPPYSEDSARSPINTYGLLKVEAESHVLELGPAGAVARPILLYGWPPTGGRPNPVSWWVESLRAGNAIKVVDNVFTMPLLVDDCAHALWSLVLQENWSSYNLAGAEKLSLYEFALSTAQVFGLDSSLISPVPDTFFKNLAPRPRDTSFDITKARRELGFSPCNVRDGLTAMRAAEKTMR